MSEFGMLALPSHPALQTFCPGQIGIGLPGSGSSTFATLAEPIATTLVALLPISTCEDIYFLFHQSIN
jgi:hypothetical protein